MFSTEEEIDAKTFQKLDITVVVGLGLSLPVFSCWLLDIGMIWYVDPVSFLMFMAPFLFLIGAKGVAAISQDKLLRATIVGMLGPVLLSMIMWLAGRGDPKALGPAAAGGLLGILYGSLAMLLIGALSHAGEIRRKATWRAS